MPLGDLNERDPGGATGVCFLLQYLLWTRSLACAALSRRCTTARHNVQHYLPMRAPNRYTQVQIKSLLISRPPLTMDRRDLLRQNADRISVYKRDPKTVNHDSNCFGTAARKFLPTFMCAAKILCAEHSLEAIFDRRIIFLNLTATLSELEKQLEQIHIWIEIYHDRSDKLRLVVSQQWIFQAWKQCLIITHTQHGEKSSVHRKSMTDFEKRGRLNK